MATANNFSTGATVGYARTSTTDQKAGLAAQARDLKAAGCTKLFQEEVSSVDPKRTELDRALDYVREGDVLVVTKLDGTSKGGMVVAIQSELGLPVKFIGVGEQPEDLQPFDPQAYAQALFSPGE